MDARLQEANALAHTIAKAVKCEKIILFGSAARGGTEKHSDIDLLVIKKSKKKRPFRVKEIFQSLRGIKRKFPLDAIVYTPEEIEERLSLGDYFIKNILSEGKILYG